MDPIGGQLQTRNCHGSFCIDSEHFNLVFVFAWQVAALGCHFETLGAPFTFRSFPHFNWISSGDGHLSRHRSSKTGLNTATS